MAFQKSTSIKNLFISPYFMDWYISQVRHSRSLYSINGNSTLALLSVQVTKIEFVTAKDNIYLASHHIGIKTGVILPYLQHFQGTIDYWGLFLIIITLTHAVILLDNAGIGHSSRRADDNVADMGNYVIEFQVKREINITVALHLCSRFRLCSGNATKGSRSPPLK